MGLCSWWATGPLAGHDDTFWLGSWLLSHEPPEALPPSCSLQLIRVQLECRQPASPVRSTYLATSELPSSTSIQFPNARFGWFKTRVFAGFGGKFGQFVWCLGVLRMKTLQRPLSVAHQWIDCVKTYQSLCNFRASGHLDWTARCCKAPHGGVPTRRSFRQK